MKRILTPDETMLLWDAMRSAMNQWRDDAEKYPSTREDNLRRAEHAEGILGNLHQLPDRHHRGQLTMKPTHTYEPAGSSFVTKVEWWAETKILAVTLAGGRTYRYAEVPAEVHREFLAAESAGKFFGQRIKANFKLLEG